MATLIDETNFDSYLKQSSQGRSGTPDGNVFFDLPNNRIEFIGVDELATFDHTSMGGGASDANQLTNFDGITLRGLYNFENQERRVDESLRTFLRGSDGTYRFAGAFDFINGVKLSTDADRNKVRNSGFIEYAANGSVDRIYHGVVSLVDVQATTQPYYALVANTLEATLQAATFNDFARLGDINEAVQVFGTTANGDTGAGAFDFTTSILVARVRSWQFNAGETTSIATGIAEFSGFSAGYGVGELLNPSNIYDLVDVIGGAQISPWTGMTLEKLSTAQTETGFNQSDGDFTWVLNNTASGTAQQCAAYLDAVLLQDSNIDDGAGTYNGRNGRVWYTRNASGGIVTNSFEGAGLFIDGLSTAEQQNVILTDDAAAAKTYPFFPTVQITVGADAVADTLCWYHVYYVDGASTADFDTASAVTVNDYLGAAVKGFVNTDAVTNVISFAYAYDTNTQAGLSAASDKPIVVLVEGDGGVAQAITFATITRDTVVPITCVPAADNNA
jgi:hypothetical protein